LYSFFNILSIQIKFGGLEIEKHKIEIKKIESTNNKM